MIDTNAIKTILTTLLRQLISAGAGAATIWASKRGLDLSGDYTLLFGGIAVFVVNLLWSIGTRLLKKWEVTMGLQLEPGTTHAELHEAAKEIPVLTRISE